MSAAMTGEEGRVTANLPTTEFLPPRLAPSPTSCVDF